MKDFRDLKVWQKAHSMCLGVYKVTAHFPADERYGLTSQLKRAAVSISANIAEGCGRGSDADLARFLQMSMGSASEVECLLLISRDLELLANEEYTELDGQVCEVKRMLTAFIQRLRADR